MSSPLSAPFSLFPSRSSSPHQTSYTCAYPPCSARFAHPSDLDFHQATHHSTMGHSPITALNLYPDLTFPTPPTSIPASPLQRPTPTATEDFAHSSFPFPALRETVHEPLRTTTTTTTSHARPPLPALETRGLSSSSSSMTTSSPTLRHIKSWANFSLPFTHAHHHHHHHPSPSSSSSSSSSSSTSSPTTNAAKSRPLWTARRKTSAKTQKRNTACVMRCGRHGDEWLGLRGWRLWR
ncbi:MAG: hypothetical protein Q9202_007198 [Teloschistes flavicans]